MSDLPPPATQDDPPVIEKDRAVLKSVQDHQAFEPKWDNRRRVINWSLIFCATIIGGVMVICTVSLLLNRDIQANITSVFITLVTSDVFFALAVIGSYVFGATWEANNFRDKLTDVATAIVKH